MQSVKKQNISSVKQNIKFISELDLRHESRVGILIIGADYYYSFFLGKIIKNSEDLVDSSTVLGWILSEPATMGNSCFTGVCFESHSMHCNVKSVGKEGYRKY